MAERHVLVTVRIGPTGSFCREPDYGHVNRCQCLRRKTAGEARVLA